jgi:endonuclease-3 related protein
MADSGRGNSPANRRRVRGRVQPLRIYRRLLEHYGPRDWWPGKTRFEIALGAILTQNTAWANVEKALAALRARRLLSYRALSSLTPARLAPLIRCAGTFRVKARRVIAFVRFVGREYAGRIAGMRREPPASLRRKLLAVKGIGQETADAIALYAAGQPNFVVDAYTRRIFERLGLLREGESYETVQRLFTDSLPVDAHLYNDYHAQLVELAKQACRAQPCCRRCPLDDLCPKRGVRPARPASGAAAGSGVRSRRRSRS